MLGQLTLLGHTHCVKHSSRLSSARGRRETGAAQEAQRRTTPEAEEALNADRERRQALSKGVEARKREVEDQNVPEMRGQGVHAKALRIRAFWSEIGRTPGCPACETPGTGKSHTRECKSYQAGTRADEQHQRRRRNAELLEIRTHDHWTRVRVQQIPTRRDQKQPL